VPWEKDPELRRLGGAAFQSYYENLTLPLVIGGGLVDGINPCAFAVIIFFITYMTYVGKTRKEMAQAGVIYTAAVFATYFAIGLGLNKVFGTVPTSARRVLYVVMIVLLLVAAGLSFLDALRCLRGQVQDIKLKLPEAAKNKIRQVITRQARSGLTAAGALVTGVVVAFLEFPCTGQVYAPIVAHLSADPAGAIGWLLLYNLCFIVPLVIVFLCILFGVTSQQFSALFQRHVAKTKFALTALFVMLVAVLVLTMP